jgi:uncharacterized membrane protein HdeD (DUF308 family)
MSVELVIAGVVLIAGGILQIRVQRWSQRGPSVRSDVSLVGDEAPADESAAVPSGESDAPPVAEPGRARGLWVAWTQVLGVISIVFGVVVLVVAFTR